MHTKKVNECAVTSERSVFLRGFRQYPYFVAQEYLVAFEASKCRRSF